MRVLLCSTNSQLRITLADPHLGRQLLLLPLSNADSVGDTPGRPNAIIALPWVCVDDENWAAAYDTVALLVSVSTLSDKEALQLERALVGAVATIGTLVVAPQALPLVCADTTNIARESLLPITVEHAPQTMKRWADLHQRLTTARCTVLLEGDVCVEFETSTQRLAVRGSGSAVIFTLLANEDAMPTPIRLDVLADGMSQQWLSP